METWYAPLGRNLDTSKQNQDTNNVENPLPRLETKEFLVQDTANNRDTDLPENVENRNLQGTDHKEIQKTHQDTVTQTSNTRAKTYVVVQNSGRHPPT